MVTVMVVMVTAVLMNDYVIKSSDAIIDHGDTDDNATDAENGDQLC